MRVLFIVILISCQCVYANNSFIDALSTAPPIQVNEVNLDALMPHQMYLATPFAQPIILNAEQKKVLQEKAIIKVQLVYTRFRTSPKFDQVQLNKNRLNQLKNLVPTLFESPLWEYELVEQTAGQSREVCGKMFHGFIITFRPSSSKNSLTQEADYLKKLVDALDKQDSLNNDSTPKEMFIRTHYDPKMGYIHDTNYVINNTPLPDPPDFFYNHRLYKDSTVLNALARNKSWKDVIIVTDVTGSMSPYIAQVFVWLKNRVSLGDMDGAQDYFVFFNDGDNKESRRKKPLETKGIYMCEDELDDIEKEITKAMLNGSGGGENLENDIEAIIEGLKHHPKYNQVILIADNLESMRDYDYIEKIKVPVHVILCGAENRINIQYLDLARQTKGSVHTKTSDITNLHELKNGQEITIDGKKYKYQNKRFHFVYEAFKYQNKTVR